MLGYEAAARARPAPNVKEEHVALNDRQRALLHLVVRRYDRETNASYLDPLILEQEMGVDLVDLAEDVDVLESQGYVERAQSSPAAADGTAKAATDSWTLIPTDRGILNAMGLE
jgi:hypothetical protein